MTTILILGSLQSLFLVFLLASKKEKDISDSILGVWLGHIGFHLFIYFLFDVELVVNHYLLNFNAVLPFLQGPYLYIYVQSLIKPEFRFKLIHTLHLIPATVFLYFIFFLQARLSSGGEVNVSVFNISNLFTIVILTSVPMYIAASFYRIFKHNQAMRELVSSTAGVDLRWLRYILLGMSSLWLVVILINLIPFFGSSETYHANTHWVFLILTIFIYAIGYLGINQHNIFTDIKISDLNASQSGDEDKYQRSGLTSEKILQIADRLVESMQMSKLFLQEELSLKSLSDQLDIPSHHLSQVINQHFKKSFYDFVNLYRVEEFLAHRDDAKNQNLTLLALALDSGFSSKASFNRVFKRLTGQAPSKYQKPDLS